MKALIVEVFFINSEQTSHRLHQPLHLAQKYLMQMGMITIRCRLIRKLHGAMNLYLML